MRSGDSVSAAVVLAAFFACVSGAQAETGIRFAALDQPVETAQGEAQSGSAISVALGRSLAGIAGVDGASLEAIKLIYSANPGKLIWLDGGGAKAGALLSALGRADDHALPPARYRAETLAARLDGAAGLSERDRAALEADLTAAFLRYARDVGSGLLEPVKIDPEIEIHPLRARPELLMRDVAMSPDLGAYLDTLAPNDPAYAALQRALFNARAVDPNAWGPEVPEGRTLKYGMRDARVEPLRNRLAALGFFQDPALTDAEADPLLVDEALEETIKRFQADRGLVDDGVVGSRTLAALNQSPRDRVAQVAVNLERRRWLNRDLGWRHIFVNQAAFEMTLFENGQPILESRVVVGQSKDHRTAEFSDEMEYLVFNPYWNVPKSIASEEILPILKKDPGYLARNNMTATPWNGYTPPAPPSTPRPLSMGAQPGQELAPRDPDAAYSPALERARAEARAAALAERRGDGGVVAGVDVAAAELALDEAETPAQPAPEPYNPWRRYSEGYFPYTIRQNPGAGNALGDVKFLFPNHHSIYMHDTPSKKLFLRERRDFSHGCVRLQKPMELAEILLGWQTDDPTAVMRKMLAYTEEKWISLREKVPVHLTYQTARLNQFGALDFLPDVYGRDALVAAALEAEGVSLR